MKTTGTDDARIGSTGADERIFGLIAIAEDQQAAVRAAIEGLALERAALAKDRVTLVQTAEKMQKLSEELAKVVLRMGPQMLEASAKRATQAVNAALAGVGAETTHAVTAAAKPTLEAVAETVTSARAVQQQLRNAVRDFGRKWVWIVVCAIAGGHSGYGAPRLYRRPVADARARAAAGPARPARRRSACCAEPGRAAAAQPWVPPRQVA